MKKIFSKADEMELAINYKAARNAYAFLILTLAIYCLIWFLKTLTVMSGGNIKHFDGAKNLFMNGKRLRKTSREEEITADAQYAMGRKY